MADGPHDVIEAIPVVGKDDKHIIIFNVAKGEFEFLPAGTRMVFDTETGKLFTVASGNNNIHLDNDGKILHEFRSFAQTDKLDRLDKHMKLKEYVGIYDSDEENLHVPITRTAELEKPEENIKIPVAIYDNDKEILPVPKNTRTDELEKPEININECGAINAKDGEILLVPNTTTDDTTDTAAKAREKRALDIVSVAGEEGINVDKQIYLGMAEDGFYIVLNT